MRPFGTVSLYTIQPVKQASYVIKLVEDPSPQMIIKKPQVQMNKIYGNHQPQLPHIIQKTPFYHQQRIHILNRQPLTFRRPARQSIIPIIPPHTVQSVIQQNSQPNPPSLTHLLQSSFVNEYKPTQFQEPQPQPLRQQVLLDQDNQMSRNEGPQRYSRVYKPNTVIVPPLIREQQLSERTDHIRLGTTQPLIIPPPRSDQQLSQKTQHIKISATQPLLLPRQQIIQQEARQNFAPVTSQIIPNDKEDNASVSSKKSYVNFNPIQPIHLNTIKKEIVNNKKPDQIIAPSIPIKKQENPNKQKDSESQISVVEFNILNPILIEPSDSISVVEFGPIKPIFINSHR